MNTEQKIQIKWVGFDSWSRPMFQTRKGTFLVDTNIAFGSDEPMRLCTKNNNEFDGEPDSLVKTDAFEVVKDFTKE